MKTEEIRKISKFALVGVCNTLLDYGLFFLFLSIWGWDKNIAQILATAIAMTNSYLVNRYWTFGKSGSVQVGEMGRFLVVNLLSLLTTLVCLNVFYDGLSVHCLANSILRGMGFVYQLSGEYAVLFCKVLAMPFSLLVNFLGNRLWVFGKES